MATKRQIEANRLNARFSTGPRTPEGKAVSSMNALKSALDSESQFVLGENRADFAKLQTEYFDMLRPRTPFERYQMDRLIRSEWLLRRMMRVESHLWEYHVIHANRFQGVDLGESFSKASPEFMRLHRRNVALERSYTEAWAELERAHAADVSTEASAADHDPAPAQNVDPAADSIVPAEPVPDAPPPQPSAPTTLATVPGQTSAPSPQTSINKTQTPKLGSFLKSVLQPLPPAPAGGPQVDGALLI